MVTCQIKNQGATLSVVFSEDIISKNTNELRDAIFTLLHDEPNDIITINLDMIAVNNIDSEGLNFLVSIVNYFNAKKDGTVNATINNKRVRRTFEFTRMTDLMKVTDLGE